MLERSMGIFVENNIPRKMIFTRGAPNTPTDTSFFVINKDPFIPSGTTLDPTFQRNERKALTAPDMKM